MKPQIKLGYVFFISWLTLKSIDCRVVVQNSQVRNGKGFIERPQRKRKRIPKKSKAIVKNEETTSHFFVINENKVKK